MNLRIIQFIAGFVAFLWLNASTFAAADVSSAFDNANKMYDQGKFAEAASAYENVIQSGSVSVALYFNLGNSLFKAGKIGEAMAAFRKAEQLAPRDPDVHANIQFVRNQIQGPTLSSSYWQRWLEKLTVNEWTVLASIALWCWLILLALIQFRPGWKQSLRRLILVVGIAVVAVVICLATVLSNQAAPTAIVTTYEATVRNGPFEESPSAFTVHDGAEVRVLDQKNNWLQVTVGNRIGWLKREQALLLKQ